MTYTTKTPVRATETSVYTTKYPHLYAKFCSEVNLSEVNEALEFFEKCHGKTASVEVIFIYEDGHTNRMATPNDPTYGNVLGYNFSDAINEKYDTFPRQLLVRVSPATL